MFAEYPSLYEDAQGQVQTIITNDGKNLQMIVRQVTFHGPSFEDFVPASDTDPLLLQPFKFHGGCLIAFSLSLSMPIPIVAHEIETTGLLHVKFLLGKENPVRGGVDKEELWLTLEINGVSYPSQTGRGWFEDGLLEIQKQLPVGVYMKICLNCRWSEYWIAGYGLFANLACFRDHKDAARSVVGKFDLIQIWDLRTEFVQETYLCPEFENRDGKLGFFGNR